MRMTRFFAACAAVLAAAGIAYGADTYTSYYNLTKPEIGASANSWGTKVNSDLDTLDAALHAQSLTISVNTANIASATTTANAALARSGGTMTGAINMGGFALSNLPTPSGTTDATTKTYVDSATSSLSTTLAGVQTTANAALPKAGGTMSGTLNMGGAVLTNLPTPSAASDAATKTYVDSARIASATVTNLKITNNSATPNTKIDVTADSALLVNSSGVPVYTNSAYATACTVNLATTGDKGMDTGSMPVTGWVYVYLQGNGSTFSCIGSASAAAPTLTSGYTYSMRVGAMYSSGSALRPSIQRGRAARYVVNATLTALPAMDTGTATQWTPVPVAAFVPSTATQIAIRCGDTSHASSGQIVACAPNSFYSGYSAAPLFMSDPGSGVVVQISMMGEFNLESANVYWQSTMAGGFIACMGWTDSVSAN